MDTTESIEDSNEKKIKDNLIRLITSGDEAQLELAIQMNIGLRLLDWEEVHRRFNILLLHDYVWRAWTKGCIFKVDTLLDRFYIACFIFKGSHYNIKEYSLC